MAKTLQHQIIGRALEVISEEKHWTRCSMARTCTGETCSVWDPAATRFCAVGAIWRAAYELTGDSETYPLVQDIADQVVTSIRCAGPLQTISDLEGHAFVVGMFRTALGHGKRGGPQNGNAS